MEYLLYLYRCNLLISINRLTKLYTEAKQYDNILTLLKANNELFSTIPKARTAKIVRSMLNIVATVPDSLAAQIQLCNEVVSWCKIEKRNFLRQRVEAKVSCFAVNSSSHKTYFNSISLRTCYSWRKHRVQP